MDEDARFLVRKRCPPFYLEVQLNQVIDHVKVLKLLPLQPDRKLAAGGEIAKAIENSVMLLIK